MFPDFVEINVSSKSKAAILMGFARFTEVAFRYRAMNRDSFKVWNVIVSGAFRDAGVKKLETALLDVVAVIRRFGGGGEMSTSADATRFGEIGGIFAIYGPVRLSPARRGDAA